MYYFTDDDLNLTVLRKGDRALLMSNGSVIFMREANKLRFTEDPYENGAVFFAQLPLLAPDENDNKDVAMSDPEKIKLFHAIMTMTAAVCGVDVDWGEPGINPNEVRFTSLA